MKQLPKKYNFRETEKKWQEFWQQQNIYKWNSDENKENNFVIDTPPPTVSGHLHIGHIYSYTQADIVARYQRMKGKNVFYPMGFDNNGLPTERLVEKNRKIKAVQMERAEFQKICKAEIEKSLMSFRNLFNSTALSVDWYQEYQTIDNNSQKISQMSFLDLYQKDQIYRSAQPMLWDPVDRTALAQADIEDKEQSSFMNDITFNIENGEQVTIATTRPELLAACVAVFYHPEDERYKNLAGKFAITPLFNVKVPFLADDKVDMEKGTGLVMCCTFGDNTDIEWWKIHKLPLKIILNKAGCIEYSHFDDNCLDLAVAEQYFAEIKGLKIKQARAKIIEILTEQKFLIKQVEVQQTVKCAERSGAPLEILATPQWFIKTIEHKEALKKRAAELNWHPSTMKIKLDNWIDCLNWDWCISRQRFFGVPFPIWYSKRAGEEGKVIIATKDQLPIDPLTTPPTGYSMDEVIPDQDVMDTWATSSVTPQLNSLAISKDYHIDLERHKNLFPADLRPQAHEIIRTWAFYTILKAHLHETKLPWKNIMVSGWCLAEDKSKMSKSKGNVIKPENILEMHGADIVRYWTSTSRLGADTAFSEDVLKIGKKLVNKLWNASKFAAQYFDKLPEQIPSLNELKAKNVIFATTDLWILTKLAKTIELATQEFEKFEYCKAREHMEEFFWKDFCDNYLEIAKVRAYNQDGSDEAGQMSAIYSLYYCLDNILKLFAPFIPHVTEEIYQHIFEHNALSIHERGLWPKTDHFFMDDNALQVIDNEFITILDLVRKIKAEQNLSIKAEIELLHINIHEKLKLNADAIKDLLNVTNSKNILDVRNALDDKLLQATENDITIGIEFHKQD